MINSVLKFVRKILVVNTVTGHKSEITFEDSKPNTLSNRTKLDVAGIPYEIKNTNLTKNIT